MEIRHEVGVDGARAATGIVIVVDVLRSFTLSAYALAGGARECLLVRTVDEARELAASIPGAFVSAEEDTRPVPGIAISNSPTQIAAQDLRGRTVVQRSSAGTQAVCAIGHATSIYAASLVVAKATAQACLSRHPDMVTLVASADFPEDHACCSYIEGFLTDERRDPAQLLQPLFSSSRYRELASNTWPGFPKTDLDLALEPDRFNFAMPVVNEGGRVRVVKG